MKINQHICDNITKDKVQRPQQDTLNHTTLKTYKAWSHVTRWEGKEDDRRQLRVVDQKNVRAQDFMQDSMPTAHYVDIV